MDDSGWTRRWKSWGNGGWGVRGAGPVASGRPEVDGAPIPPPPPSFLFVRFLFERRISPRGLLMATVSYHIKDIRNIALAGHGASAKTSLADALLFAAGATDRRGSVDDGTSFCDVEDE